MKSSISMSGTKGSGVKSMDWKPKRCRKTITSLPGDALSKILMDRKLKRRCKGKTITSLPVDVLSNILGMLPTKDVVAMQVLCKRMSRDIFSSITSLDFDDSCISYCDQRPHLVERLPLFEEYVDDTLLKLSPSQPITRFRLHVGGDKTNYSYIPSFDRSKHRCDGDCFPYPEPSRTNAWISFPLTRPGLKELDIFLHVQKTYDFQLPPQLFTCRTLEVLKIDSNIELDGAELKRMHLPNLKLLHLRSLTIVKDDIITRLVLTCPLLEDLAIVCCCWDQAHRVAIFSRSLRKLELVICHWAKGVNTGFVLFDTPNLQYFYYDDNLASRYSVTNMNALVQATVNVRTPLQRGTAEHSLEVQLGLIRMLSNVQHLSLSDECDQERDLQGAFKGQLPVFRNLKTLELSASLSQRRWDVLLLEILTSSPCLESLVFPFGFFDAASFNYPVPRDRELVDLEEEVWKTTEVNPQCCQSSLRQIVIKSYLGLRRELNIVKFILSKASVLQELVVVPERLSAHHFRVSALDRCNNKMSNLKQRLKELPRASVTCSVKVENYEFPLSS